MMNDLKLKEEFIRLLREDPEIKQEIRLILSPEIATKDDIRNVLQEIKQLREDFQNEIKQLREDFNRMENEIKQLNERYHHLDERMKRMEITLGALGDGLGRSNGRSVRDALRELFQERFNVEVKTWTTFDDKGLVYGRPSEIEADIVILDGEHWLIECKSRIRRADVAELLRIMQVYEEKEGTKPTKLYMITPFADEDAHRFAAAVGITIISRENWD